MKTAELTGSLLDFYAGKAAGEEVYLWTHQREHYPMCVRIVDGRAVGYSPSTEWAQGGPMIDKFRIHVQPVSKGGSFIGETTMTDGFLARVIGEVTFNSRDQHALVAIMRAVVESKFGGTVPDEVSL